MLFWYKSYENRVSSCLRFGMFSLNFTLLKTYYLAALVLLTVLFFGCQKESDKEKDKEKPQSENTTNKAENGNKFLVQHFQADLF